MWLVADGSGREAGESGCVGWAGGGGEFELRPLRATPVDPSLRTWRDDCPSIRPACARPRQPHSPSTWNPSPCFASTSVWCLCPLRDVTRRACSVIVSCIARHGRRGEANVRCGGWRSLSHVPVAVGSRSRMEGVHCRCAHNGRAATSRPHERHSGHHARDRHQSRPHTTTNQPTNQPVLSVRRAAAARHIAAHSPTPHSSAYRCGHTQPHSIRPLLSLCSTPLRFSSTRL